MALVSNLHFGLTAWSASTFAVGQRCSSGGNAYQCTTGGASSAAPTGTGSAVSGGGSVVFKWLSAVDYTTLQAWANALPATLTQPVQLLVWNDGPITTTPGVPILSLSGHTTSATNTISISPAAGEGFASGGTSTYNPFTSAFTPTFGATTAPPTGNQPLAFNSALGASFGLPASFGGINYFSILDANVTVSGLQFQDPNATSGSTILSCGANFLAQGNIFDGYSQGNGAYMLNPNLSGASGSVYRFINNLIVDRAPTNAGTSTLSSNYSGILANNTFVAINAPAGLGGITDTSTATGITIKQTNNIMLGYPNQGVITSSQNASTAIAVDHSLVSASSFTNSQVTAGAGNIYAAPTTGQFVNPATDFRTLTTSQAYQTGATDTADIPAAIDIFGTPRVAPWNIGAYQNPLITSTGSGGGQASGAGVAQPPSPRSIGSGGGHASGLGQTTSGSIGSGGGHASGLGTSTGNISVGSGGGQASGIGYTVIGAINAQVIVTNPGTQVVNTAFPVTGSFTLVPDLLVSDDATAVFTPIPSSGISPLGTTNFDFLHPGLPITGTYNLLIEDLSTDASAATNYAVVSTQPPPPPPPVRPGNPVPSIGATLTGLAGIIPAYVYQEYADDENVQAFFQAYNILAQGYLDYMNSLNLPIYTGLSGSLLDWVAQGLYGIKRPVLASVQFGGLIGPFNTYQLNEIPINSNIGLSTSQVFPVTDDIFKRIMTWDLYKGDGTTFSVTWLKRRVMRFLAGAAGTDYTGSAAQVSVQFTGTSTINIKISTGTVPLTLAPVLQAAVLSGTVQLPFQYTFNVLVP